VPAWQVELECLGHSAWNAGLAAAKARMAPPTAVLASAAGILAHHPAPPCRMLQQR
jgi:hypothetical protein